MARRPEIFDQQAFEQALRQVGCPENFIKPAVADFRLFVPIIFKELGEEKLLEIIVRVSPEIGLGIAKPAWKFVLKYLVDWAEQEIENYKLQKQQGN